MVITPVTTTGFRTRGNRGRRVVRGITGHFCAAAACVLCNAALGCLQELCASRVTQVAQFVSAALQSFPLSWCLPLCIAAGLPVVLAGAVCKPPGSSGAVQATELGMIQTCTSALNSCTAVSLSLFCCACRSCVPAAWLRWSSSSSRARRCRQQLLHWSSTWQTAQSR